MTGLSAFIEILESNRIFEPGATLSVARAPGRLDVMGGIADYSGSLVLQRTIAEATFAALQVIDEPMIHVVSIGRAPYSIRFDALLRGGAPAGYEEARALFHRATENRWAAYVVGVLLVLMRERGITFSREDRDLTGGSRRQGRCIIRRSRSSCNAGCVWSF